MPKVVGGFGLRKLIDMNKACMTKLSWLVSKGGTELWCNVLQVKYKIYESCLGIGEEKEYNLGL